MKRILAAADVLIVWACILAACLIPEYLVFEYLKRLT